MIEPDDDQADWERLLAAERQLQRLVPGAVLVGGTAAALHAGHRVSRPAVEAFLRRGDHAARGWKVELKMFKCGPDPGC